MNTLKMLEAKMSEEQKKDWTRNERGLFWQQVCSKCGVEHGGTENGVRVILSVVNNKILCFKHGMEEAEKANKPRAQRAKVDHLSGFGLKQEVLL